MTTGTDRQDKQYQQAMESLRQTLDKLKGCRDDEKSELLRELRQLEEMTAKLTSGRVEIVVFGEISTGKSALINALVGSEVASVDVQGGWTKEVWKVDWEGCAYCVPGLADSQVVLIDTPGVNEVGGQGRADMAREAAERADLILFVVDSDLNETEFNAITQLASAHKPIIVVFNKLDLYTREQRTRLTDVLRERLNAIVPAKNIVQTSADPREMEYVIESADGSTRSEWRTPPPDVEELKARILQVLEGEGLALIALNAAMYAADRSDRIATVRVELRSARASQTIWSYAAFKAIAVGWNPWPVADVLGGSAIDATMIATLSRIYGLEMNFIHARRLAASIVKAAGWVMLGEAATHVALSTFKGLTLGYSTLVSAVPQGAAAGYGSYIVGQAAKYYFEHGSSWGGEGPKAVVTRILDETDKDSVLEHLKDEIRKKIRLNRYAKDSG